MASATPPALAAASPDNRVEVSDRPAPVPGIELVGELRDSAFAERQWLVQRDGGFIQVSELLYRIIEHADGERTLGDIAAAVSDTTEWLITAEQVRHLIEAKLIPLGLIADSDGSVVPRREPSTWGGLSSPLSVHMQAKAIGPRAIEPIARVLQYLFLPPVLVFVVLGSLAAHAWLYVFHDFTPVLLDVLFTPGAILIVLLLVLAAAVFHEFGHASALRYGGGRARAIGAGFYLFFPAFYTDVTDSYRLGRWARVRTGLGGLYFHLIFAVGVIGASLLLQEEFLLLAVPLITLEIARQLIPAVRLDGYWVLADLTGVPDFFSQALPFLRSFKGARALPGERLPTLKPWARAFFATYLLATIPALVFVAFLIITYAPQIVMGFWDAFRSQIELFGDANRAGDYIIMATVALQIAIFALPAVGLGYFFWLLAWKPLKAAWKLPQPTRRAAAVLGIAGVFAGLGFFWVPQISFGSGVPAGVVTFDVQTALHVRGPVSYPQAPPVGGNHSPIWQNCGFYDVPIAEENGVHSLEHGAVWITYRPGLPERDVNLLRAMAQRGYVLVSPYPRLNKAVVASAWGRQLRLNSVRDARLEQFVDVFRLAASAPEAGGPCTGGTGEPR
jgi:putative peptide zinc metalloprotease protein